MLTHIEGMPESGMTVSIGGKSAVIKELGRNSTDGKVVSSRSCLTGQPCSPYGSILVEWNGDALHPEETHRLWVQEEAVN